MKSADLRDIIFSRKLASFTSKTFRGGGRSLGMERGHRELFSSCSFPHSVHKSEEKNTERCCGRMKHRRILYRIDQLTGLVKVADDQIIWVDGGQKLGLEMEQGSSILQSWETAQRQRNRQQHLQQRVHTTQTEAQQSLNRRGATSKWLSPILSCAACMVKQDTIKKTNT